VRHVVSTGKKWIHVFGAETLRERTTFKT